MKRSPNVHHLLGEALLHQSALARQVEKVEAVGRGGRGHGAAATLIHCAVNMGTCTCM